MSTHAGLLMLNPNPTGEHDAWAYTHIHFDGYPNGVGYEVVEYFSSNQQVAKLIEAGFLNYMRHGVLHLHDDLHPTQYYASLEAVVAATDRGPDAYRYVWDGLRWHQLGEHVTLLPLWSFDDMTGVFGE